MDVIRSAATFINERVYVEFELNHKIKYTMESPKSKVAMDKDHGGSCLTRRRKITVDKITHGGSSEGAIHNTTATEKKKLTYAYPVYSLFSNDELLRSGKSGHHLTKVNEEEVARKELLNDIGQMFKAGLRTNGDWVGEVTGMTLASIFTDRKEFDFIVEVMMRIQDGYFVKHYRSITVGMLSRKMAMSSDFLFRFFWKAMLLKERKAHQKIKWDCKVALEIIFKEVIVKKALQNTVKRHILLERQARDQNGAGGDLEWLITRDTVAQVLPSREFKEAGDMELCSFIRKVEQVCTDIHQKEWKTREIKVMYGHSFSNIHSTMGEHNFKMILQKLHAIDLEVVNNTLDLMKVKNNPNGQTNMEYRIVLDTLLATHKYMTAFLENNSKSNGGSSPLTHMSGEKHPHPIFKIAHRCHLTLDSEKNIYTDWVEGSKPIINVVKTECKEKKKKRMDHKRKRGDKERTEDYYRKAQKRGKWSLRTRSGNISMRDEHVLDRYMSDSSVCGSDLEDPIDVYTPKSKRGHGIEDSQDIVDFDRLTEDDDEGDSESDDFPDDSVESDEASEVYTEESEESDDHILESKYLEEKMHEKHSNVLPKDVASFIVLDDDDGEEEKKNQSMKEASVGTSQPVVLHNKKKKKIKKTKTTSNGINKRKLPPFGMELPIKQQRVKVSGNFSHTLHKASDLNYMSHLIFNTGLWHVNNWNELRVVDCKVQRGYYWQLLLSFIISEYLYNGIDDMEVNVVVELDSDLGTLFSSAIGRHLGVDGDPKSAEYTQCLIRKAPSINYPHLLDEMVENPTWLLIQHFHAKYTRLDKSNRAYFNLLYCPEHSTSPIHRASKYCGCYYVNSHYPIHCKGWNERLVLTTNELI